MRMLVFDDEVVPFPGRVGSGAAFIDSGMGAVLWWVTFLHCGLTSVGLRCVRIHLSVPSISTSVSTPCATTEQKDEVIDFTAGAVY